MIWPCVFILCKCFKTNTKAHLGKVLAENNFRIKAIIKKINENDNIEKPACHGPQGQNQETACTCRHNGNVHTNGTQQERSCTKKETTNCAPKQQTPTMPAKKADQKLAVTQSLPQFTPTALALKNTPREKDGPPTAQKTRINKPPAKLPEGSRGQLPKAPPTSKLLDESLSENKKQNKEWQRPGRHMRTIQAIRQTTRRPQGSNRKKQTKDPNPQEPQDKKLEPGLQKNITPPPPASSSESKEDKRPSGNLNNNNMQHSPKTDKDTTQRKGAPQTNAPKDTAREGALPLETLMKLVQIQCISEINTNLPLLMVSAQNCKRFWTLYKKTNRGAD